MKIYKYSDSSISLIKEKPFKKEKEIQSMFENNLQSILHLDFVQTEFVIKNRRFDTLAFDRDTNSFVIIEYKLDHNSSLIDQGFAYLKLLLEYQAEFKLAYWNRFGSMPEDIDWSQSRIVFVARSFTPYQLEAVNFKDLTIDLYEVKRFANDTVYINRIRKDETAPSIKTVINKKEGKSTSNPMNQIKSYTEEDHLEKGSEDAIELYKTLRDSILSLDTSLEIKALKVYIAIKKDDFAICTLEIHKNFLWLFINAKMNSLDDPKHLMTDYSEKGHWGLGDYGIKLTDDSSLEYILFLIKQLL